MAAFIVATVTISDLAAFKEYAVAIEGLAEKHGGEAVYKGGVLEVLEGEVPEGERVVITKFPDADAARAYINDSGYQAGKAKRIGAAQVNMRLLEA